MEALIIKPTKTSLDIDLDPVSGILSFSGRARPENSAAFFNPIIAWMLEYSKNAANRTEVNFKLEYFNSAARKSMAEVFNILEEIALSGKAVIIKWNYDETDEGMRETGEEYRDLFKIKFEFIPY